MHHLAKLNQKPITGSLDLTNGVGSYVITTKQRLLPGYAGEILAVTTGRKILAPSLKLRLTQVTSRGHRENSSKKNAVDVNHSR